MRALNDASDFDGTILFRCPSSLRSEVQKAARRNLISTSGFIRQTLLRALNDNAAARSESETPSD
jgi:hypothetical protein